MANEIFYPTASTVAVFVNGIHVEEAYRLDYRDSVPKTPIFGYNDYEYTKVARGKGLVQGLLVINFVVPFYLNNILADKQDPFVPKLFNYKLANQSTSKSEQFIDSLKAGLRSELPPNSDTASKAARAEFIAGFLSKKDKALKEKTKQALYEFFNQENESAAEVASVVASTQTMSSPLVVTPKAENGNTVDVYYHDPEYITWFIRFNRVEFTEISQQISQAGSEGSSEPLYEIWQFIAQNKEIKIIN